MFRLNEAGQAKAQAGVPLEERSPTSIVVLSIEASLPPKSMGQPSQPISKVVQGWMRTISKAGGQIWEHGEGCFLVCWVAREGLKTALKEAVTASVSMREQAQAAGYKMSAGIAPGAAQLSSQTSRPPDGWELAGPFYLARWMMNLSAHRGRILLTEVGQRQVSNYNTSSLGRISIQGNRYIQLYEIA